MLLLIPIATSVVAQPSSRAFPAPPPPPARTRTSLGARRCPSGNPGFFGNKGYSCLLGMPLEYALRTSTKHSPRGAAYCITSCGGEFAHKQAFGFEWRGRGDVVNTFSC